MSATERPERDMIFRASPQGFELRADGEFGGMPTMVVRWAVFNRWTEINSVWEGRFLERMAPGAFKKTIRENRDGMKALFQHGMDPQVGDKPMGPIREAGEDGDGAYGIVPLLDTSYNRDILPGLQAGLYGASFRFQVIREEIVDEPGPSEYNPLGLPERTVKEARVAEFGPVTFPAYADASAAVRSGSDFILDLLLRSPERTKELVERRMQIAPGETVEAAPPEAEEAEERRDDDITAPSELVEDEQERREAQTAPAPARKATPKAARNDYLNLRKDKPTWLLP